eukprot:1854425-Prymnesium_polylepis.1
MAALALLCAQVGLSVEERNHIEGLSLVNRLSAAHNHTAAHEQVVVASLSPRVTLSIRTPTIAIRTADVPISVGACPSGHNAVRTAASQARDYLESCVPSRVLAQFALLGYEHGPVELLDDWGSKRGLEPDRESMRPCANTVSTLRRSASSRCCKLALLGSHYLTTHRRSRVLAVPVQLHHALFSHTGGYVLKPQEMRSTEPSYWPPARDKLHRVSIEVLETPPILRPSLLPKRPTAA